MHFQLLQEIYGHVTLCRIRDIVHVVLFCQLYSCSMLRSRPKTDQQKVSTSAMLAHCKMQCSEVACKQRASLFGIDRPDRAKLFLLCSKDADSACKRKQKTQQLFHICESVSVSGPDDIPDHADSWLALYRATLPLTCATAL